MMREEEFEWDDARTRPDRDMRRCTSVWPAWLLECVVWCRLRPVVTVSLPFTSPNFAFASAPMSEFSAADVVGPVAPEGRVRPGKLVNRF